MVSSLFEVILLIGSMILLLILKTPMAFAMIISAWVTFLFINNPVFSNPSYLSRLSFYSIDMFALLAVPFFLLAGELLQFGLAKRLIDWVQSIVGFIRGALGYVVVLSSLFFGAISGSFMATIAAIGTIMLPEMEKNGYDKIKSAALLSASGFLGILIPPSVPSLIYATVAGLSVAELFVATILPGTLMACGFLVINYFVLGKSVATVSNAPKIYSSQYFKNFVNSSKTALPILLMPIIVLGGIYGGIVTPTEAGVIAVIYALILGFAFRLWKSKELLNVFLQTGKTTAVVLILVAFASPMARIFSVLRIPTMIADLIMSITTNPYGVIAIVSLVILIMGMFLDTNAIIILTIPVFAPLVEMVGFDPIHYASLTVVNLGIGCITPPFGFGLFMGARIANIEVYELLPSLIPYLIWCVIVLAIVLFFPGLSLWLPNLLF